MDGEVNITRAEQDDQFDHARALLASYALEGAVDGQLSEILMQVRDTCGADSFNRLLVLSAAIPDPRFAEYGGADVLPLLRDLEITADLKGDVERLLEAMRQEDTATWEQARRDAAEASNPYRRAAVVFTGDLGSRTLARLCAN